MRKRTALFSITAEMFITPFSIYGLWQLNNQQYLRHAVVEIACQEFSETFISPHYLEYFSLQVHKGEEGLYLGLSYLHSFISSILCFIISEVLLDKFCPDPRFFSFTRRVSGCLVFGIFSSK